MTPEAEKELDRIMELHRESLLALADAVAKKANRNTISEQDVKMGIQVFEGFQFIANVESLITNKNPKLTELFFQAFMRKVRK